ncbi:hypothetical protein QL285_006353 [Trifolium repens]|nr:hypothetical protein QL285_006353 [Trifolium repens]
MYVWYRGGYVRITVIHHDFPKAIKCCFCKIIVDHRDSDTFTIIPNIDEIYAELNRLILKKWVSHKMMESTMISLINIILILTFKYCSP